MLKNILQGIVKDLPEIDASIMYVPIEPKMDAKIGRIKDVSAAAVLTCALISAVVGLLVFIPYFFRLLCD